MGFAAGRLKTYMGSVIGEAAVAQFQAFRADDGKYRWRVLDENGRAIPLNLGSIRGPRFTGRKRKAVEKALDEALARMAGENVQRRSGA